MIKSISIFFPLYNDENTVDEIVNKAVSAVKGLDYEIILVNDGSQDNTRRNAEALARKNKRIRVVNHPKNKGYGGALKSGFKAAKKEWVFYTDGDAQYDVLELKKFLKHTNYNLIQGYKRKRKDGLVRNLFGLTYAFLAKRLYDVKIRDPTCDFRLINMEFVKNIRLTSDSGFICVELIKKLEKQDVSIKELPITHFPRRYGSSQAFNVRNIMLQVQELFQNRKRI